MLFQDNAGQKQQGSSNIVDSALTSVYTEDVSKTMPIFSVPVPILPVLGLLFHEERAQVKILVLHLKFWHRNAITLQN